MSAASPPAEAGTDDVALSGDASASGASDEEASDEESSDEEASDEEASDEEASDEEASDEEASDEEASDEEASDEEASDADADGSSDDDVDSDDDEATLVAARAIDDEERHEAPWVAQPELGRRRSHVAPAMIALDRIDDDGAFRIRPDEDDDVALLATDIARLGQLFPVDVRLRPPDRFQIICGFRRVAALRFLKREKVLARLHTDLSDEDALLLALAAAIHVQPVATDALHEARTRLDGEGRLSPAARDMLDKALGESLEPEHVEEEVDADELADDVTSRLGEINQDLSLLADVFNSLDREKREELLKQLRYSAELVAFLEGK